MISEIQKTLEDIPGCQDCDVEEWINLDSNDLGYEVLKDNKIVQSVMDEAIDDEPAENSDKDSEDDSSSIPSLY